METDVSPGETGRKVDMRLSESDPESKQEINIAYRHRAVREMENVLSRRSS